MNYKELAKEILHYVGGANNVEMVTHCATRLRFNLKSSKKVEVEKLKQVTGVLGAIEKGGQFQIIIGNDVPNVFKELNELGDFTSETTDNSDGEKMSKLNKIFDTIAGIFTPFLPALTGAGMIKAVLAVLVAFKVIGTDSQMYAILSFVSDAAFYFMPIMLAYSAAQKFKTNPYLAMTLGGILLHPDFIQMVNTAKETGEAIKFIGISVPLAKYASSVIPIILSVWLMSYIYKLADKISPKTIKFFTVPLITLLITAPLMLIVVGPLGMYIGEGVAAVITFLDEKVGWLTPLIIGSLNPLLVMTGMHYAIIPMGVNNLVTLGYDIMIGPATLASNIAQGGAVLAVAVKTKNKDLKQLASSAGITAVCGITEPAMYGVSLRLKKPLYAALIGGGAGGLLAGVLRVRRFMSGAPGLLTLPAYLGEPLSNFVFAILVCVVAFTVAFVATFILGFEDPQEESKAEAAAPVTTATEKANTIPNKGVKIMSPVSGEVVPLREVDDPTFSTEVLGKGCAVIPDSNQILAPANAEIVTVYTTKHAICLRTDDGVEVLIHVGMDTVRLAGKYFECKVMEGQKVLIGDTLLTFDREKILGEGYDLITPVIVTNSDDYHAVTECASGKIEAGQEILLVK